MSKNWPSDEVHKMPKDLGLPMARLMSANDNARIMLRWR